MLNVIFSILIIPFLPVFMYGELPFSSGQEMTSPVSAEVLGDASQKTEAGGQCVGDGSQGFENQNLFPLNQPADTAFIPTRKPDYADVKIWSGSSVVIDVDSGTLLEYADGRKKTQIASLTKIMTAVLTVENVKDLDEEVIITPAVLNVYGTTVGCPTSVFCNSQKLVAGEKISVKNLLMAMLLDSANDAATALGVHVGGTSQGFVDMMNAKAKELGLKDTHFCTPSGLEIDGEEDQCYSSAYDIARIAAYSLKHELIWDIMRTKEATVTSADGKWVHQLKNTDMLLEQMADCLGGKTGFTPLAGKSLLLAAIDPTGKHRIIAVILNDESRWTDMKTLVAWTFDNYEWK